MIVELFHAAVPPLPFAEVLARARGRLSPEELEAAHRFRFERDRVLYAAAHLFLRTVLAPYAGSDAVIVRDANGKPELADRRVRFNLSHTAGRVLAGVTREADLGVDVEKIDARHDDAALAERVLTPAERATLGSAPSRFYELWTLKEAYAKARGLGLSLDPRRYGVGSAAAPRLVCEPGFDDAARWQFFSFVPADGYAAAAAVRVSVPVEWRVTEAAAF